MKPNLPLACVMLTLAASTASAYPGLDIAWSGATSSSMCPVNPSAMHDLSILCDTNYDSYGFSMAFKAPAGISKLVAETFYADVMSVVSILPDWWHLEDRRDDLGVPPGCRGGDPVTGQVSSFGFSTSRGIASTATCKDYWHGAQAGGVFWTPNVRGPGSTRLMGVFAIASANAGPLTADVEYFVGTGSFDSNHAVADPTTVPPTKACDGCLIPACLVFTMLYLQQPAGTPGGDVLITTGNNFPVMTWQGGGIYYGCYTPVRRSTWGQVKSLYR